LILFLKGECYLLCEEHEKKQCFQLLSSVLPQIKSNLFICDDDVGGPPASVKKTTLEVIWLLLAVLWTCCCCFMFLDVENMSVESSAPFAIHYNVILSKTPCSACFTQCVVKFTVASECCLIFSFFYKFPVIVTTVQFSTEVSRQKVRLDEKLRSNLSKQTKYVLLRHKQTPPGNGEKRLL